MLQELDIKDLATIKEIRVNFFHGMTVLTGETGAGKSILIDALALLTGGRGSKGLIRSGAKKLTVQGLFTYKKGSRAEEVLDHYGIDHDDSTIVIQRQIYKNGRNVCRINGLAVNTEMLKALGAVMVDIQGQDAHQTLMNPATHLHLLDAFAAEKIGPILQRYQKNYHQYQHLSALIAKQLSNRKAWMQHLDMLKFQVKDIHDAQLKPHEDEELVKQQNKLKHSQAIDDALHKSYHDLNGDGQYSPLDMLDEALEAMQNIAQFSPDYQKIAKEINDTYYNLQDVVSSLSDQMQNQTDDEGALNDVEARLDLIDQLKRKYGNSVEDILKYYDKIKKQLAAVSSNGQEGNALKEQVATLKKRLHNDGQRLSEIRHTVSRKLEQTIHEQLQSLYMGQAEFRVKFTKSDHFLPTGLEQVEFYVRTNPGGQFLPLAKSASGGELSRIMLALKTVFVKVQHFSTVVFDEIDTGVSGRVAEAIGAKMVAVSKLSQVLCITHLPQVAALSDHHYHVQKDQTETSTTTHLRTLNAKQRVQALARMLAGKEVTQSALNHARELLKLAQQAKTNQP